MPKVKLSIVFETGARIGPEHAALLESVREVGSISAAARAIGIPYKRAWMLLDSLNRAFKEPWSRPPRAAHAAAGATLTPFGADVLERYRRMLAATEAATVDDLALLTRAVLTKPVPKP